MRGSEWRRWTVGIGLAGAVVSAMPQQRPTFRTTSNTVVIEATVFERGGRLVPDLTRDDFEVHEDGERRPITGFSREEVAISLALLLDLSDSMRPKIAHPAGPERFVRRMRAATEALVAGLPAEDRASLGVFNDRIGFTPIISGDKRRLLPALDEQLNRVRGPTPFWEIVNAAIDRHSSEPGRRIVFVFTDAQASDGSVQMPRGFLPPGFPISTIDRKDVIAVAARFGFIGYWIGFEGMQTGTAMDELIARTGGGQFLLEERADLSSTFARVVQELRHLYVIGFSSARAEPGRSVDVRVRRPNHHVRARRTYVAGKD